MKTHLLPQSALAVAFAMIVPLLAYSQGKPVVAPNRPAAATHDLAATKRGPLHDEMRKLWHDHVALTRDWSINKPWKWPIC